MPSHLERTVQVFTQQAATYAGSSVIAAEEARRQFVAFVDPSPGDRVLDVATGPGFLARHFAPLVAEVIGVDVTPAMLRRAEAAAKAQQATNVRFQYGLAESLPFPPASFDICTCGLAFHHFGEPERVLAEMARVTRPGGKIAILDIITAETPVKAAQHNRLEQMRDPSHVRFLPLSELAGMWGRAGLRDLRALTYRTPREQEEWCAISQTPSEVIARIQIELLASLADDTTGLGVHLEGDRLCFEHTFVWIIGTLPDPRKEAPDPTKQAP